MLAQLQRLVTKPYSKLKSGKISTASATLHEGRAAKCRSAEFGSIQVARSAVVFFASPARSYGSMNPRFGVDELGRASRPSSRFRSPPLQSSALLLRWSARSRTRAVRWQTLLPILFISFGSKLHCGLIILFRRVTCCIKPSSLLQTRGARGCLPSFVPFPVFAM
jgi:hypothetical protein